MAPTLIAIAGPSRSGKGTCASIFTDGAQALGLTVRERQLSGPGKQYVASAWHPEITEEEAIEWFDDLKTKRDVSVGVYEYANPVESGEWFGQCTLQQYLQRMLQGARDRWDADFWTDKLLPLPTHLGAWLDPGPVWVDEFRIKLGEHHTPVADLALISDLRQVNEARRVKALGGYIVEMWHPPIDHTYVTSPDHVTEQRLSDIAPELVDYVIRGSQEHNDETFAKLKADCGECFDTFVRPILLDQGAAR